MEWVAAAVVIDHHFQITRRGIRAVGLGFAKTTQFGRDPLFGRLFDVEHGASERFAPHQPVGQPEHITDHMGQATVRARRHRHGVKAAALQELLKSLIVRTGQGIVEEEILGQRLGRLEHRIGIERAHVQTAHPGAAQNLDRKFESEALGSDALRALFKIGLVLEGRKLLECWHDVVERALDTTLIGIKTFVLAVTRQGMAALIRGHACGDRRRRGHGSGRRATRTHHACRPADVAGVFTTHRLHVQHLRQPRAPPETVTIAPRS